MVKQEPYQHNVGFERTKAVIEPCLSDQWFLKMEELAQPALKAVLESDEVNLVPTKFNNTYRHWMETSAIGIFPSAVVGATNPRLLLW